MTLVTGCYERFIFGLELPQDASKDRVLTKSFAYPCHQGAVKCIAAGGGYVVSGGADDQLHIYEVQAQKDLGFLMNPGKGPVTAVGLYGPPGTAAATHLFSGGADGTFAVWSAGSAWECMKVMTGHHKEITSLAVHPSGKLALTTSRDSTLRIWDLIKGRCSYHNVLPAIAETVCFSPSGTLYALQTGSQVTVHDIGQERGLVATMQHSQRVLCMAWHTDDLLLTGIETGSIHVWDVKSGTEVGQCVQAHRARIKGLVVHHTSGLPSNAQGSAVTARTSQQKDVMVASAASDGMVKTWRFDPQGGSDCLQLDSELSTGARLTCLCLVKPVSMGKDTDLAHKRLKAKQRKALAAASKTSSKGLPVPLKKGGVQKQQTQKPKPKLEAEVDLQKGGVAHDGVVDFTAEAKGKGSHQISASQASTRTSSQQPKKRNRR